MTLIRFYYHTNTTKYNGELDTEKTINKLKIFFLASPELKEFYFAYELGEHGDTPHSQGYVETIEDTTIVPQSLRKRFKHNFDTSKAKCYELTIMTFDPPDIHGDNYLDYLTKENEQPHPLNIASTPVDEIYGETYQFRRERMLARSHIKKKRINFCTQIKNELMEKYPEPPRIHNAIDWSNEQLYDAIDTRLLKRDCIQRYADENKTFPGNVYRSIVLPYLWELKFYDFVIQELD